MGGSPPQFENNYFAEMCSGSEAGSYLRLIDLVNHSTLGLRVITKKVDLDFRYACHGVGPYSGPMPRLLGVCGGIL